MSWQVASVLITGCVCVLASLWPFLSQAARRLFNGGKQNCPPPAGNNLESRMRKQEIGMATVTTRLGSIDEGLKKLEKSVGQIYDHLRNSSK